MTKPKDDEKRHPLYVVTSMGHRAGRYVGETKTHVVLSIGDLAQGFLWSDVEPVDMREVAQ